MNVLSRFIPYIKLLFMKAQSININEIPGGSVLDIGGGGEGIIAQIGKERVTAIDKRQDEIDEAKSKSPTSTWVVADATNLDFDTGNFDNATAFFSGMYMTLPTFDEVCKEAYRVIKDNGEFWIWDAKIPDTKGLFIIRLSITLPDGDKVRTAYGSGIKSRNLQEIISSLENAKFHVEVIKEQEKWFFLKASKQRSS